MCYKNNTMPLPTSTLREYAMGDKRAEYRYYLHVENSMGKDLWEVNSQRKPKTEDETGKGTII
jgi:hypothetical protein